MHGGEDFIQNGASIIHDNARAVRCQQSSCGHERVSSYRVNHIITEYSRSPLLQDVDSVVTNEFLQLVS